MHDGMWLSINDYSALRNISISTIRRHIKANRVKSKMEGGKYYIFVNEDSYKRLQSKNLDEEKMELKYKLELSQLQEQYQKIKEENAELRMLINAYEQSKNKVEDAIEEIFT